MSGMHLSSLEEDTVTRRIFKLMMRKGRLGTLMNPLAIEDLLLEEDGIRITAFSTHFSAIRNALKLNYRGWGYVAEGPRDITLTEEERERLGPGNFYRIRRVGQPTLFGTEEACGL